MVCYKDTCRNPRFTFFIDACLGGLAVALVAASLWFAYLPTAPPGIAISFSAPPLSAGAPVPLSVTVRSTDGQTHDNVRLWWRLPDGAQVLEAFPALSSDGMVFLGTVSPGQDVSSRVIARMFLPAGSNTDLIFSVMYDEGNGERQLYGTERRPIVATALTADIPPEFRVNAVARKGVLIPLRIENPTSASLPSVHLSIKRTRTADEERLMLGDLGPHEVRWTYLPVTESADDDRAFLSWTIGAAGRDLAKGTWEADITDESFPLATVPLISDAGKPISIGVANVDASSELLVMQPLNAEPVRVVALTQDQKRVQLEPLSQEDGSNHEWFVAFVRTRADGFRMLGPATRSSPSTGSFPFTAQILYRSSAGDQLGLGPNPPRVGAETRYWAFWTVGPVDAAMRDVVVEAELPPGVKTTGNVSTPDGGIVTLSGKRIRWTLPGLRLPSDSGNGLSEATFGVELSVTPTADQEGKSLLLLQENTARALDTDTSRIFEAQADPQTSVLPEDANIEGAGIVQPVIPTEAAPVAP